MKRTLLAILATGICTTACASDFIPYYGNNPFLFCTLGVPEDCWLPVRKETGEYRVTDYACFKKWSASLFSRVCREAFPNGATDNSTSVEDIPFSSASPAPSRVPSETVIFAPRSPTSPGRDPADASP